MSDMSVYNIDIRNRRQATLPQTLLKRLGVGVGDSIIVQLKGDEAVIKPKKKIALEALKEIQNIFNDSDILQKEIFER
jgi:bifunctional DNA-binding transcriptional regulator/antitoxin component of YhaV-PrlF toxin-antitoxin module